ncbi:hypothetical protein BC938DRAFT_474526 [Jimgerdemannia flammicorona]|uniref:Uncharacterized protein n=1 Tax=Jimgerdemannia flammicorona TaxID=994334 RepID=A0A433Q2E6_9FUNG|nr:hypothetical protein BC938DRAFT_474526 [Jimgerdemannia flammicorona]
MWILQTHVLRRLARRPYSTAAYGTPLFNCTAIASTTTLGLHLLWYNLDYAEYREDMEGTVKELEGRIKELEAMKAGKA